MIRSVESLIVALVAGALSLPLAGCPGSGTDRDGDGPLAPPWPVNATAGYDDVTLNWSPVNGATSYNLYWATNPGVTKTTGALVPDVTSPHTHGGLSAGTTYHYVLTSLRGAVEGPLSVEVSATPEGPLPPTGVTASAGDRQVTIDWQTVPLATSYNLYWSTSSGVTKGTGTLVSGVTAPYVHGGLTNGVAHYYVLTTVQGADEGLESLEVSATPFGPGILDPSFGGMGWVIHHNAGGGNGHDYAWAMALDGAGRILAAGDSVTPGGDPDMAIWRYNDDGSLDTTFNGQGWVTHHDAAGGAAWDMAWAIALDASGKIVVAGDSDRSATDIDMVIWRYNDDGSLDGTFNGQGWVVHDNAAGGSSDDSGYALTFDSSGRILVTGESFGLSGDYDMVIWRYEPTGAPDATFGSGGVVVHDNAAGGGSDDSGYGLTTDGSGRILVTGYSWGLINGPDMIIWCYDDTGMLDSTFGSGGIVVDDGAAGGTGGDSGDGIVVDPSGRVLVSGWSDTALGDDDVVVWRYDSNGMPDAAFGIGGVATHHDAAGGNDDDTGFGLALVSSARILVTGRSRNASGNFDMTIWAFDSGGFLDPSFGAGGAAVHDGAAGGIGWDFGRAIAMDVSGRIVVAGSSVNPADQDMALWRYR